MGDDADEEVDESCSSADNSFSSRHRVRDWSSYGWLVSAAAAAEAAVTLGIG
jgi:hypothetical protein